MGFIVGRYKNAINIIKILDIFSSYGIIDYIKKKETFIDMQYQGGKSRISKKIAEVIDNEISRWQKSYSEVNSHSYRERERVIAIL